MVSSAGWFLTVGLELLFLADTFLVSAALSAVVSSAGWFLTGGLELVLADGVVLIVTAEADLEEGFFFTCGVEMVLAEGVVEGLFFTGGVELVLADGVVFVVTADEGLFFVKAYFLNKYALPSMYDAMQSDAA